jgi:uncharacterized LabA/DUF88 family protein
VKDSTNIELAVDAMQLAEHVDQIVLFSGNGDFRSLVEAVQRRGVRVTVVSTFSADELRRQADSFINLLELKPLIDRILDNNEHVKTARSPAPMKPRLTK